VLDEVEFNNGQPGTWLSNILSLCHSMPGLTLSRGGSAVVAIDITLEQ
jgi:hypothetical protein